MSKKRGVVVSMTDHVKQISKSKSAQVNLVKNNVFNHAFGKTDLEDGIKIGELEVMEKGQLAESNLLYSQPECIINQAYYTYEDPDFGEDHDSNKQDQNDQYFIEPIYKKIQMQQKNKKQQEKQKQLQRLAKQVSTNSRDKKQLKNRQTQKNKSDRPFKKRSSPRTKIINDKVFCKKNQLQNEKGKIEVKKQVITERLKPKPLDFNVDILQKLPLKPANKKKTQILTNFKTMNEHYVPLSATLQNEQQSKSGENRNCRKLPFRFQAM